MQTLALENYGTSELSFDEQRENSGGTPWLAAYAAVAFGYFVVESMTNPVASTNALMAGFAASQK